MTPKIADTVSSGLEEKSHQETLGKPTLDDKDFETTHARIHVYDSRPASDDTTKPLVLFLHGNSFCSKIWLPFFRSDFAYTHRLIALDYPGHGESGDAFTPESSYNMPGYADATLQVLKQIDESRPIVAVGWSLGGHVAIEMIQRCNRIKGIVITGTPPVDDPDEVDKAFTFGSGGWKEAAPARASISEEEIQMFAHGSADPPYEDWMEQCVRRTDGCARELMFKHVAEGKSEPEGLMYPALPGPWSIWGQKACVETSEVPIAVINGKNEPFINLAWIRSIKFKNLWRNTFVEMENCLHAPFWARRDDYQMMMEEFLRDVSQP